VWKQRGEEYRVYGGGGWMWCSSTRVCGRQRYTHCRHGQSLQSSTAAVDAALAARSSDDVAQPSADDGQVSQLHRLLTRRLELCATEDRIKTSVEDLIVKHRTDAERSRRAAARQGMAAAAAKYRCYSTTCITGDGESTTRSCYSPLCRSVHEQESSSEICLLEKLRRDVCRLSCAVPNDEDENMADESSTRRDAATGSSPGSHNRSESVSDDLSNNHDHNNEEVDSGASEDGTRICDNTKKLRSVVGLLQRHVCNGRIGLTEVLVSRLRSLLDCGTDARDPVCLRGAVSKSGQKRAEIPAAHGFRTRSCRWSVFVLPPATSRHLARSGGMLFTIPGFSSAVSTKSDYAWMYVGPRPLFSTAWQYRTASARNLSAVALQLRVLRCCIRWDDMSSDGSVDDASVGVETDMVTTTTILRRRDVGLDGLRSEYLVRRVKAPAAAGDDWHGNLRSTLICIFCLKLMNVSDMLVVVVSNHQRQHFYIAVVLCYFSFLILVQYFYII